MEGKQECKNFPLTDEITLNIGENDFLVGMEILDAKDVLGVGNLSQIVLENIPFQVA